MFQCVHTFTHFTHLHLQKSVTLGHLILGVNMHPNNSRTCVSSIYTVYCENYTYICQECGHGGVRECVDGANEQLCNVATRLPGTWHSYIMLSAESNPYNNLAGILHTWPAALTCAWQRVKSLRVAWGGEKEPCKSPRSSSSKWGRWYTKHAYR